MNRLAAILLATALLGGCTFGSGWKRQVFAFSLPANRPAAEEPSDTVALNRVTISPLFQSRSFTYRIAEDSYERDPYAGFLIRPEQALAEAIRARMRASGVFGRIVPPGTDLAPNLVAEVSVTELYGDFRKRSQPVGTMQIHFICYKVTDGGPSRTVLDKVCARETPMTARTPEALMAAWDSDLREMMEEINSAYIKAGSTAQ